MLAVLGDGSSLHGVHDVPCQEAAPIELRESGKDRGGVTYQARRILDLRDRLDESQGGLAYDWIGFRVLATFW